MAAASPTTLSMNRIHDAVQRSGLHFVINQTPFSSYITIRRKFTSERNQTNSDSDSEVKKEPLALKARLIEITSDLKALETKNRHLEENLVIKEEEFKDGKVETEKRLDYVHVFAEKLSAETERLKGDKSVLDNVIKNLNNEASKHKNEMSQLCKTLKIKDKEIYNLDNKALNQQETIKHLKAEKIQVLKEAKKLKQKSLKKQELMDSNENMNTVDKEFEVDTKHIISATLAGQPCTTPTINVSSICINRMILTTASLSCASSILSVTGSLPISSTSISLTTTSTSPSTKSSQSALTQIIESPKRTILSCVNLEDGPILKKKIVNCEFC